MIKKFLIIVCVIVLIPLFIISFLIKQEVNKTYFNYSLIVRVKREQQNKIELVPLENYIIGVLSSEMPISFEEEALKAQAVAARTYVIKKMELNKNKEFDILDTVNNQVYLNQDELQEKWGTSYNKNISKLKKIIDNTRGEYLTYQGKIIDAFYFSTSSGKTENSEDVFSEALPYLRSVDSEWDEQISPVYQTSSELSLHDFYEKLDLNYDENLKVEIIETTTTGRIKKLKINNKYFLANEIVKKLSLRSSFFEINQIHSNLIIDTKGYGHGVGMSQYGAQGMAKDKYTYKQILLYYYKDVEIKNLKDV